MSNYDNSFPLLKITVSYFFSASSMRFLPQIAPFVPRQHLLYLLSKGEMVIRMSLISQNMTIIQEEDNSMQNYIC